MVAFKDWCIGQDNKNLSKGRLIEKMMDESDLFNFVSDYTMLDNTMCILQEHEDKRFASNRLLKNNT